MFLPKKYTKFKYIQMKFESELDRCHPMWYILISNHSWSLLCTLEYMRSFIFESEPTDYYCIDAVCIFISIKFKKFATFCASMLIIDDNSPTSFFVLESIELILFSSLRSSNAHIQCSIPYSCCKFTDNRGLPLSINSTKWYWDKKERGLGVVEIINVAIGQRGVILIV